MEDPILYVLINKELKMSAGKAAAQAVHAAMSLEKSSSTCVNGAFASYNRRTVIVLEADNAEQLRNLQEYLKGEGLQSEYYIDEGVNEVGPYSITALAVEPIDGSYAPHREIFAPFKLFGYKPKSEPFYVKLLRGMVGAK